FSRRDRELNLSRYDVGGVVGSRQPTGLQAYLFSDRGLYRPGEAFRVGIIIKSGDWKKNMAGVPLEAVIRDSRGLEIHREKFRLSKVGFHELSYKTENTSPTGRYQISVYIVKNAYFRSHLGTTSVRVEEFLPDRMKITSRFSKTQPDGWVSPYELKAHVSLRHLIGTPAVKNRISGRIKLSPTEIYFWQYKNYLFTDPLRAKKGYQENLIDQHTDEQGEAVFSLGLKKFDRATYRLNFVSQGFKADGGRAVSTESSVLVSPMKYLLGYKADGSLSYIPKLGKRHLELIAINSKLRKVPLKNLQVQIREIRYVSALIKQPNGVFKYQSVKKEILQKTSSIHLPKRGLSYLLPSDKPGDFVLTVKDKENTELAKVKYRVIGQGNISMSLDRSAELQVRLNKTDYHPGESIQLQIVAPYTGSGLITIEREKVYAFKWFQSKTLSSTQTIELPKNMEGNGYIQVSFIRSADSKEIFMSPLSYSAVPFTISKDNRLNKPVLNTPDRIQPGKPLRIRYRGSKKGKIIIYAVDEGILQAAGYQTPRPIHYFFRKRGLQVRTSQILDQILPEYSLVKRVSATGGGGSAAPEIGKNLNPFKRKRHKAVVYWSGILNVDKTDREVVYNVPDYFNGTLRVIAVIVSEDSLGVSGNRVLIKDHFVIQPNIPTFVSPGDTFEIGVSVHNNLQTSGKKAKVSFQIKSSKNLKLLGQARQIVTIPEERDVRLKFQVQTGQSPGSATLTFIAEGNNKKSILSEGLSI
ncbi:MAG: MG2 domain-containing protein, partial [Spirochaetota bacterium]|nr:MG2 domain-containing protein [Spirochaetota bacterium]